MKFDDRDLFGADDLDIDLALDDDDEEFGLLGIALSDKAKAKKWAKKYVEANTKLVQLKRMNSRGRDTATRKNRGPFQSKNVDVDRQIYKLEKDASKALKEYRSTKVSKGPGGKRMHPAEYLESIGEMTGSQVAKASRRRREISSYGLNPGQPTRSSAAAIEYATKSGMLGSNVHPAIGSSGRAGDFLVSALPPTREQMSIFMSMAVGVAAKWGAEVVLMPDVENGHAIWYFTSRN